MPNIHNIKTFTMRSLGCSNYLEDKNYAYLINSFFTQLLKIYSNNCKRNKPCNIYSIFSEQFAKRTELNRKVLIEDMDNIESICYRMLSTLQNFIDKYNVTNIFDKYSHSSLVGNIGGIATISDKQYTVDFSFYDPKRTFYDLYHYRYNLGLYNKTNKLNNDLLVYVVQTELPYMFNYDISHYTIKRGLIAGAMKSSNYRPGPDCITCSVKDCRARLITDLERL